MNGDSFTPERPRLWYARRIANIGNNWNLDLAPDGRSFVVLMSADNTETREDQGHVTLVMNFFDEVRRRTEARTK